MTDSSCTVGPEMLGRGLAAMRTRGWTGDEPRAVAAFLRNVWTTRISAETGHTDPVEVLIALAGVAEDVRPQAGQWQERTGDPVVAEHFRRLVAHARDTADRDEEFRAEGWWERGYLLHWQLQIQAGAGGAGKDDRMQPRFHLSCQGEGRIVLIFRLHWEEYRLC